MLNTPTMILPREAKADTMATALLTEPKSCTVRKPTVALQTSQMHISGHASYRTYDRSTVDYHIVIYRLQVL